MWYRPWDGGTVLGGQRWKKGLKAISQNFTKGFDICKPKVLTPWNFGTFQVASVVNSYPNYVRKIIQW